MKNKTYHIIETVPKSNNEIIARRTFDNLTHTYTTVYFSRLVQCTSIKSGGDKTVSYGPKPPMLVKWCSNVRTFHM
jgi:hypothetical protein